MNKMKRSLLTLCFLALLCPFPAMAAMPLTEITADVAAGSTAEVLLVEFIPKQTLAVKIRKFTQVSDLDLDTIEVGTSVKIEAFFTHHGLIAWEISPGDGLKYELKGYVEEAEGPTENEDGTITLRGGTEIPVPASAEITYGEGIPVDPFEDLDGKYVKVEGIINDDGFLVTEVKVIADFECTNNAKHIFKALKSVDYTHKMTEHYCELSSGKRGGTTQISFADYTGADVSTYTVGKYDKGDRHGYWLTIDVTGNVAQECLYNKGNLVDGDLSCPE